MPSASHALTLARLHLGAVLPALEDLVRLSPPAAEIARGWNFPLRLRLIGQTQATIVPKDGLLAVTLEPPRRGALTLNFVSAPQLNRTFLNQSALPPLPTGALWHLVALQKFTKLTKLLDAALQPTPEALRDPAFLSLHLQLLFKVLIGALPILAERDVSVRHSLSFTPSGVGQIRMDGLGLRGWVRWDGTHLTAAKGEVPGEADVQISFRDAETASAALRGQLDAMAAIGRGQIQVCGLVPLADGLSMAMDRVESYLKPVS